MINLINNKKQREITLNGVSQSQQYSTDLNSTQRISMTLNGSQRNYRVCTTAHIPAIATNKVSLAT